MASFFFSAALGSIRQVLLNSMFGTGAEANAYYAAFRLPDALFSLIAGGALSSAMIPILLSAEQEDGREAWERLSNLVLTSLFVVVVLVVAAGEIFAPAFVHHVLAPGFDARTSRLTINLSRLMLVQPLILVVGSVATAVLNSRRQFFLTAISHASHNVAIIGGIFATAMYPSLGIYGPTLGVVGGSVLQVLLLLPGVRDNGVRFRPSWNPGDVRLRQVVRLLIPNGLSVGVSYAGIIIDTAFASTVPGTMALPAIQNAWLLISLPTTLIGQGVGQAAFPRLALQAATLRWRQLRRTLIWALSAVVVLSYPVFLALGLLGRFIIRLLFEHGRFGAAAGTLTYHVLLAYVFVIPFGVATEIATRGLLSLRDARTPLLTNLMQLAGRAAIAAILIGHLGVIAIPLAFVISGAVETVLLIVILLRRVQRKIRPARALNQPG